MTERNEHDVTESLDLEFERLFSSLDDVKASDELKASTLAAILALENEDGQSDNETLVYPAQRLAVIEGGGESKAKQDEGATTQVRPQVDDASIIVGTRPAKRPNTWKLRVAAVLLAIAIGVGGTAAYALPATHVYATTGDATFDLGVNVFGITVSAEASNAEGEDILRNVDVRNTRFEDAFERVLAAYEEQGGEDTPTISVRSSVPFADGARLNDQAQAVMDAHQRRRDEGIDRPTEGGGSPDADVWQDQESWEPTQPDEGTWSEVAPDSEPSNHQSPSHDVSPTEEQPAQEGPQGSGGQVQAPADPGGEPSNESGTDFDGGQPLGGGEPQGAGDEQRHE